jgi:tetratricopeptide (TPR) repeat protein
VSEDQIISVEEGRGQDTAPPAPLASAGAPEDRGLAIAQVAMSAFLILTAGFLVYFNLWRTPFHGADQAVFVEDTALHRVTTWPDAMQHFPGAPLSAFGAALNWRVFPGAPGQFAGNLALHLACAVLLYLICRCLLPRGIPEPFAMAAGMLFAVHPLLGESVYQAMGRPVLQGAFFLLAGLLAFLQAARSDHFRPGLAALAMIAYALAFASDAMTLMAPFLFLAADGVMNGADGLRRNARLHLAFLAALLMLAVSRIASGAASDPAFLQSAMPVLAVQTRQTLLGLQNAFAPAPPLGFVPGPLPETLSLPGGLLLALLAGASAILLARRSMAGLALFWCLTALTAIPCLAPLERLYSPQAFYLPLAGLLLLIPWLFQVLRRPPLRVAAGIAAAMLVLSSAYLSYRQSALWADPIEFWTTAADRAPESVEPWRYLGRYARAQTDTIPDPADRVEAIAATGPFYRAALERDKNDPELLAGMAMALLADNRPDEALPLFRQALHLNPFDRVSTLQIARILESKAATTDDRNALRAALDYYRRAERMAPLSPETEIRYAMLLAALGDIEQALPRLHRAVGDDAESPMMPVIQQLDALARQIQTVDKTASELLMQNAASVEAITGLAEAAFLRGQTLRAFYYLDLALRRAPENNHAWVLMGCTRAQMNAADGFLDEWGPQRRRNHAVWEELARHCARAGAWEAALRYLEHASQGGEHPDRAEIRMADIAIELRQPQRAQMLLQQTAEKAPEDPAPWLRLADLAIEAQDKTRAGQFLAEAEKRHAFPEDIEARRKKAGIDPDAPFTPVRTIIR